jgi:hypothetical protein
MVIVSCFALVHLIVCSYAYFDAITPIWLQLTALTDEHQCTSSGRRKTTTPTESWVASLALPILIKKPFMGVKEFQTTLQDQ